MTSSSSPAYPELEHILDAHQIPHDQVSKRYEHCWLCWLNLREERTIAAIPPFYACDVVEKRTIYITGVPAAVDPIELFELFANYGEVDKVVVLLDMISQSQFRWGVMKTVHEAAFALEQIHGLVIQYLDRDGNMHPYQLRACEAVGPENHVTIEPRSFVDQTIPGTDSINYGQVSIPPHVPLPPSMRTVHGHPSPPRYTTSGESTPHASPVQYPSPAEPRSPSPESTVTSDDDHGAQLDTQSASEDELSISTRIPTDTNTPPVDEFITQAASWANIAGVVNPSTRVIDLHPNRPNAGPRLKPVGRIPSISGPHGGEPLVEQGRVVFLLDLPKNITLTDISDAIKEGPLRSINFGIDETKNTLFAGVIFQHAKDAELFCHTLSKERIDSRPDRFKFVVDAIRGEPFPADDTIKQMGPPNFASRRLTIVKSRFFFMFGEKHLRNLCEKHVSAEKIQLIWLYNGGNATIVFSDVESAISIKTILDKMANGIGLPEGSFATTFEGLQTTFSKDPCVIPLELKTAMA